MSNSNGDHIGYVAAVDSQGNPITNFQIIPTPSDPAYAGMCDAPPGAITVDSSGHVIVNDMDALFDSPTSSWIFTVQATDGQGQTARTTIGVAVNAIQNVWSIAPPPGTRSSSQFLVQGTCVCGTAGNPATGNLQLQKHLADDSWENVGGEIGIEGGTGVNTGRNGSAWSTEITAPTVMENTEFRIVLTPNGPNVNSIVSEKFTILGP